MHILTNKKNKAHTISILLLLFLILINLVYFYLNLNSDVNSSGYAFKELFINYQAGLIRRGLLGEIFWILNNFFLIKPITFFCYLFLLLHLTQIFLFFKIFKKYSSSYFIYFLVFLSPALILFHIYDSNLYFIKDVFIKLTILFHAYLIIVFFKERNNYDEYITDLPNITKKESAELTGYVPISKVVPGKYAFYIFKFFFYFSFVIMIIRVFDIYNFALLIN